MNGSEANSSFSVFVSSERMGRVVSSLTILHVRKKNESYIFVVRRNFVDSLFSVCNFKVTACSQLAPPFFATRFQM